MAVLRHTASGRLHALSSRTVVGRAAGCGLRVAERHVSGEHATIRWVDGGWQVRDLGSRNGTFLAGIRLETGASASLPKGAEIAFGDAQDPWILLDDGPPGAYAEHVATGVVRHAEGRLLALPDAAHPDLVVYLAGRRGWIAEAEDGETRPVEEGAVLTTSTGGWRVHLPASEEGTLDLGGRPALEAVGLRFTVSRDEEHVGVAILHHGREIRLEEREHLYVLLTLARARLRDRDLPPAEQGWIDRERLLKMLAMDPNALNVAIFRARQQLEAAGVEGAAGVVEVRRGQRRMGVARLEVEQA